MSKSVCRTVPWRPLKIMVAQTSNLLLNDGEFSPFAIVPFNDGTMPTRILSTRGLRQLKSLLKIPMLFFCRHLHIGGRALLIYASRRRLASTMTLHTLEAVNSLEHTIQPQQTYATVPRGFRLFGEYVTSFFVVRVASYSTPSIFRLG